MREKESAVERRLVSGVRARGGMCWKFVSPGCAGVPDRIVVTRTGEVWFVELKADDGRLSPRQAMIQRILKDRGARSVVLIGRDDVDRFLEMIGGEAR